MKFKNIAKLSDLTKLKLQLVRTLLFTIMLITLASCRQTAPYLTTLASTETEGGSANVKNTADTAALKKTIAGVRQADANEWDTGSQVDLVPVELYNDLYTAEKEPEQAYHYEELATEDYKASDLSYRLDLAEETAYKIPQSLANYEEATVAKLAHLDVNQEIKVLFYGDSITDAGRNVYAATDLGVGHAQMLADEILAFTDKVIFYNRGIRGNTVNNLLARYNRDVLSLQPDVVVILIGINDLWTYGNDTILDDPERYADPTLTDLERDFLQNYEQLITNIQRDMPQSEIIICSPYVLSNAVEYQTLSTHLARRQPHIKQLAAKYNCIYIDTATIFQESSRRQAVSVLSMDGIHPTTVGYKVLADAIIEDLVQAILKVSAAKR